MLAGEKNNGHPERMAIDYQALTLFYVAEAGLEPTTSGL